MKPPTKWPWGRFGCVVGAVLSAYGEDQPGQAIGCAIALIGFLAAGVALHAIAVFGPRDN
jgi:hypothetical protein